MGRYKHGKPDSFIDLDYLGKRLKNIRELAYQSYVVLLFYVGCRRSEPLKPVKRTRYVWQLYIPKVHGNLNQYKKREKRGKREQNYVYNRVIYTPETGVKKKDVKIEENSLFIQIPALKGGVKEKPNELFLSWEFVDLIQRQYERVKQKNRYLWNFTPETGYNIITKHFSKKTPHWFRHNRVTRLRALRDEGVITTDDIKAVTGIQSDSTIEGYGMKTEEGIHKVAEAMSDQFRRKS